MGKIRSYISMFLLALLLFPIAEKVKHDFEHIDDTHCGITEKHFCKAEHTCDICDYVFSSYTGSPKTQEQFQLFLSADNEFKTFVTSTIITSFKFRISLRGPPQMIS